MTRPKVWSEEVEEAYRFQLAGYRDEKEYTSVKKIEVLQNSLSLELNHMPSITRNCSASPKANRYQQEAEEFHAAHCNNKIIIIIIEICSVQQAITTIATLHSSVYHYDNFTDRDLPVISTITTSTSCSNFHHLIVRN